MADPEFRRQQTEHRYDEHVRPINEMVDELRDDEVGLWMPYVAPIHGGTNARVLTVLRDAGPKTLEGSGSGFLCIENDDPTAQAQRQGLAEVGLHANDVTPWNAYPWYINRAPNAAELAHGIDPLLGLIGMMPQLQVLLLQGVHARNQWKRAVKLHPHLHHPPYTVVITFHPGRQALWAKDPDVRAQRLEHRRAAYATVAAALHD